MGLHFSVEGEGQNVVFLHGFLESSTMWRSLLLNNLPFRCIFIDLPGHGSSPMIESDDAPSMEAMALKVIEVLEALKISDFNLVGHSMGAYVGLVVKEKMKGCQKLVFLNSNCWTDDENKRRDRERIAKFAFTSKDIFIREAIPNLFADKVKSAVYINHLIEEAKQISPDAIAYSALAMSTRKDYSNEVKNNPSNYLFLHGDLDKLVSTELLLARLEDEKLVRIISNSGHMTHVENPNAVLETLLFLL